MARWIAHGVQHRLETVNGVSRVLLKESNDNRSIFEVESQKDRLFAAIWREPSWKAGWNLNELRPRP